MTIYLAITRKRSEATAPYRGRLLCRGPDLLALVADSHLAWQCDLSRDSLQFVGTADRFHLSAPTSLAFVFAWAGVCLERVGRFSRIASFHWHEFLDRRSLRAAYGLFLYWLHPRRWTLSTNPINHRHYDVLIRLVRPDLTALHAGREYDRRRAHDPHFVLWLAQRLCPRLARPSFGARPSRLWCWPSEHQLGRGDFVSGRCWGNGSGRAVLCRVSRSVRSGCRGTHRPRASHSLSARWPTERRSEAV